MDDPAGDRDPEPEDLGPVERLSPALADLLRDGRTNAVLAWLLVGVLGLVFVDSVLDVDLEWIAFVAGTGAIVLVPPIAYRDWRVMLPGELLVVALLPILVRGLFGGEVGTFATYLAVAALALVIVVELDTFGGLALTHWFAVVLVVFATLAAGAVHAMVRFALDAYLGTTYLVPEDVPRGSEAASAAANEALMVEFLWVAAAGLVAGALFDAYFRRRDRQLRRAIARLAPNGRPFRRGGRS